MPSGGCCSGRSPAREITTQRTSCRAARDAPGRLSTASIWRRILKITAQRRPKLPDSTPASSKRPGRGPTGPDRADFIYFWPLFTGTAIPIDSWRARMWLDTWV
ncbi:hypothetical protein GTY81_21105 [Streptomyces sp. SID8366]|nr:hypothetical protein [Streptomyces sp. SID8366]MYU62000.1 hypothetical protein [Streptomyces sp. SID69]